ncbi:BAD_collapsed_G0017870.mRNA.1.CDS.1 [Saccharomyces cerevisiae]|nr:BAD_collapsed_G0017870.mRNA.1.CDS.1 [Saccharomyces cerevisiae]
MGDATFFDAHAHGIDISVEAGTKYLGGHSDLLLGLASANEECWPLLRSTYDAMAMLPGADDCLLALRGMRSLHLRLKDAERKALDLAAWLGIEMKLKKSFIPHLKTALAMLSGFVITKVLLVYFLLSLRMGSQELV